MIEPRHQTTVIAGVGADAIGLSAGLMDVSWLDALNVAGRATLLSIATAVGNADHTAKNAETSGRRAAD